MTMAIATVVVTLAAFLCGMAAAALRFLSAFFPS